MSIERSDYRHICRDEKNNPKVVEDVMTDSSLDWIGYVLSEEEVKKWDSLKTDEEREEFNRTLRQKKKSILNGWVRDFDRQVIESIMKELEKK